MSAGIVARLRVGYESAERFFGRDIWEQAPKESSGARSRLYRGARIVYTTLRELLFRDTLHVRAAALTYFTVLSLVPLLAFSFALLKGFGAYGMLVNETIRPAVHSFLAGNEALRSAFDHILSFVEGTSVTSLGVIGLLALLYAATRLLRNIEGAFNQLWGVSAARELLEQLRDYVSIIVVTPLCLLAAAALTTAGQALDLLRAAGDTLGISKLLDSLIGLAGPLFVLFVGLCFLYKVLPCTNVRLASMALGGAVGALLWYAVLIAHVRFQVGVAQYNALYSGFGAIPIFLAWLQISWLVVLIGAEVAAAHQNDRAIAQGVRGAAEGEAAKERVALAAMLRIAAAFMDSAPAPTLTRLAEELDVPEVLLRDVLASQVRAGFIVRVAGQDEAAFALARPPSRIRAKEIIDTIKGTELLASEPRVPESEPLAIAADVWRALDRAVLESPDNRTLDTILTARAPAAVADRHASVPPIRDDA